MGRWIALVLLASCGRVGFGVGSVEDDAGGDAMGNSCMPVSQNDEDGDGLLDDCDPCPHVTGDAADADGDGVGDACDPRATPTESIALFDPFLASSTAWDYNSSRVEGGALVMEGSQLIGVQLEGMPQRSVYSIRADLRQSGTMQHQISIQMRNSVPGSYFCELYANSTQLYTSSTSTLDNSQFDTAPTNIGGPFVDSDIVLEMVNDPPTFTCRLTYLGTTYTSPTSTIPGTIDPPQVWIVMNGMEGGVRHFTRISME